MMNQFFKKTAFASLIALSAGVYSPESEAITFVDPANLAEKIIGNIMDAGRWAEEKSMMMMGMDMSALLERLSIDNINNGFANLIARSGAAMQEIQNRDLMEQLAFDKDICQNVTYSLLEDETSCLADEDALKRSHKMTTDHSNFDLKPQEYNQFAKSRVQGLIDECEDLSSVEEKLKDEEKARYSL